MLNRFAFLAGILCCLLSSQTLFASVDTLSKRVPDSLGFLVQLGDTAPDFSIQLDNGTLFELSSQRGALVMLQFTASWCSVCRQEMPSIESELWQPYKDKGLVLIGIDRDEPIEKLHQLRKQTGISYPLGLDVGADVFGLYADKKSGVTRNVLIDPSGKIVYLTRLFDKDQFSGLEKTISKMLVK